jgi:hypothetical protein
MAGVIGPMLRCALEENAPLRRPLGHVVRNAPDGGVLTVRDASSHEIYALELQLP